MPQKPQIDQGRVQGEHASAAGVLQVLAFTAIIDADALDALLLDEVIQPQLAEFFQACSGGSPKERQLTTWKASKQFSRQPTYKLDLATHLRNCTPLDHPFTFDLTSHLHSC